MAFDDFLNKVKETSVNAMDKAKGIGRAHV